MQDTDRADPAIDSRQARTGLSEQTGVETEHPYPEVATVLRVRRWEVRDGPFQGFDSPPGKF